MIDDLHPAIVHVPLGLAAVLPFVVLALLVGAARGWPRSTWLLAAGLQAVLFVGAVLALRTGEAAEERVEQRVPHAALETHERWATAFTWTAGGVLGLLLAAWGLPAGRAARAMRVGAVAGSFVALGLAVATGKAGGDLVYTHGAAGVTAPPAGRAGDDDR